MFSIGFLISAPILILQTNEQSNTVHTHTHTHTHTLYDVITENRGVWGMAT